MEVKVIYVIVVKEEDRSVFHIHYLSDGSESDLCDSR